MRSWRRGVLFWLLLAVILPGVSVSPAAPAAASACCCNDCQDDCCNGGDMDCQISSCPLPLSPTLPERALGPGAPQLLAALPVMVELARPQPLSPLFQRPPARSRDPDGLVSVSPLHRALPPPHA